MTTRSKVALAGLCLAGATLSGCATPASVADSAKSEHSTVTAIAGSTLKRVGLSAQARTRLGIQTAVVQTAPRAGLTTVPYSAILYDVDGRTWVFTRSIDESYQRAAVTVKTIVGDSAYLSSGPARGTVVVTVGATELYGAELGVGK